MGLTHAKRPGRRASTVGRVERKETGWSRRKYGRCSLPHHWQQKEATNQYARPCGRPASDKSPCWDTAAAGTLPAVCALVPQGLMVGCCHRVDASRVGLPCRECAGASTSPPRHLLHRSVLTISCQVFAPHQYQLVCKPQRGRGEPASSTRGLGNDEVTSQVGGATQGAFRIPVTKRHRMALPGIP